MSTKTAKKTTSAPARAARRTPAAGSKTATLKPSDPGFYHLRLYVAGQTRKSLQAVANLQRICEKYLPGRHSIEVVDLVQHPHLARGDQILAIPTLVRKLPEPIRKIIGDLSHENKVLLGLDVVTDSSFHGR